MTGTPADGRLDSTFWSGYIPLGQVLHPPRKSMVKDTEGAIRKYKYLLEKDLDFTWFKHQLKIKVNWIKLTFHLLKTEKR